MAAGIIFFAILVVMINGKNPLLTRGRTVEQMDDTVRSLLICIGLNLLCCISCTACVANGTKKEKELKD
jgi:hypothetical protein